MPQYDPKANRPKLVPVGDDSAPVDALLGPEPEDAPSPESLAESRPHLAVVPPEHEPQVPVTAESPDDGRSGMRTAVLVAVTAATVLGVIMVVRRGRR